MTAPSIRALVVDDDALARERLRALLGAERDITTTGECIDGREAVAALLASPVDLVFLDVQMPKLDGFGVLAEIGAARMPRVIFTSAYAEYAIRAFEAYALDYLLKPFDDARFALAVERARADIAAHRAARTSEEVAASVEPDARLVALAAEALRRPRYPESIAVKAGAQYVVLRVADLDWLEAEGNYTRLWSQRRSRVLTKSLATLGADVLDPEIFVRVHRSAIVNTKKIAAIEPQLHGELTLVLSDGSRVQCSRRHRKELETKLYFTT